MPATIWAERSPWSVSSFVPGRVSCAKLAKPKQKSESEKNKNLFRSIFRMSQHGQLHGFVQEIEEGFLLRLLLAQRFAGVAAKGTELNDLAAAPAQMMNAAVAQDLEAIGALMGGAGARMARADQGAIGQHDRRRGPSHIEFGNRDGDLSRFDIKLDLPEGQGLTGAEGCFLNAFAINGSSVRGTAVAHFEHPVAQAEFAMTARDGAVLDLKIVSLVAA